MDGVLDRYHDIRDRLDDKEHECDVRENKLERQLNALREGVKDLEKELDTNTRKVQTRIEMYESMIKKNDIELRYAEKKRDNAFNELEKITRELAWCKKNPGLLLQDASSKPKLGRMGSESVALPDTGGKKKV